MMGKIKLNETYVFKISIKCDSVDVTIGIKIPFFKVSVTIEPGRSLLQFFTTNCLIFEKLIYYSNILSTVIALLILLRLRFNF